MAHIVRLRIFVKFLKCQSIATVHRMKTTGNIGINMTSMAYSTSLLSKKMINPNNPLIGDDCNQVNPSLG